MRGSGLVDPYRHESDRSHPATTIPVILSDHLLPFASTVYTVADYAKTHEAKKTKQR